MEQNKEKNFVSAVVYCCNEADRIGGFIQRLDETLNANFLKYEIVVVNDASIDDSPNRVREYAHAVNQGEHEHTITLLNMSFRQGLEASMNAGLNFTIGDFVFEFDSLEEDYEMSMLMKIYRHSLTGYDIVSARCDRSPKWIAGQYYKLFNHHAHLQHPIGPETFRVLSRRAINRVHSITQSIPYRKASYANCGLAVDTLRYEPTTAVKKARYNNSWLVALETLFLYTDVPFKATMALAIFMFVVSASFGLYAIIFRLMKTPIEGWTTIIFFMSFGFSGLFIILAMIIRYLQTLVRLNFKKKDYLFESIEKLQ